MRKAILLVLLPAAFFAAQPAQAAGPLQTAIYVQNGDIPSDDASATLFFRRIKQTGATAVRLTVSWRDIAPATLPIEFHPKDPADTAYNWTYPDRAISLSIANGLTPLVDILDAPSWAGAKKVSAPALGEFATAITSRYNGSFEGLPHVKYWMIWNEPNLSVYLAPQVAGKTLVGAVRYRSMVNAFASAAHAVRRDNMVVAGLVAPFTFRKDPGPLKFMKAVLSGADGVRHLGGASVYVRRPAASRGEVDRRLARRPAQGAEPADAAVRAHHVVSTHPVQLWVTEFSWDSKPPDTRGVPLGLEAQWVSEALFRAWQAGVTMFTWFLLKDDPAARRTSRASSSATARPKPALDRLSLPLRGPAELEERLRVGTHARRRSARPR